MTNRATGQVTGEGLSTSTRELSRRLNGQDEVLLLWLPELDRVLLCVSNLTTGEGFRIEIPPESALDAFHHPYAYAARRDSAYEPVRANAMIVDG